MKNVTRCKITLSNGQRYTLRDPEALATETLLAQNPEQPEEKRLSLSLRA